MRTKNTSTAVNGIATGINIAADGADSPQVPPPFFKPFEWVARGDQCENYELLSHARDISGGVVTVLEMIEQDLLLSGDEEQRIFNDTTSGSLMRLSIASLAVLQLQIDRHFDWLNDRPAKGAAK